MKVLKLSLLAFLVGCSTNSFAGESLEQAFQNSETHGKIKAWYWNRDFSTSGNESVKNIGLELYYTTGSFYGFKGGLTIQTNSAFDIDDDAKNAFKGEEFADGIVLSEAYLNYKADNSNVIAGRQFIELPLIEGNYARFNKESFEGITYENTFVNNTNLNLQYIQKFQGKTSFNSGDGIGDAPTFEKKVAIAGQYLPSKPFDGAYGISLKNKSITNTELTVAYLKITDVEVGTQIDDISTYYAELNYNLPINNYKIGLDLRYRKSTTDIKLGLVPWDGDLSEIRLSTIIPSGVGFEVAYSTASDDADPILGIGSGVLTYSMPLIRGPYEYSTSAGADSLAYSIKYNFAKAGIQGLRGRALYVTADVDDNYGTKQEFSGYGAAVLYQIPKLKNLSANIVYFSLDEKIADIQKDELWVKLNYKF